MKKIKISLAQMNINHGNNTTNWKNALKFISEATQKNSDLILFPELWSSGYDLENSHLHCRSNNDLLNEIAETAKKFNIHIGGTLLEKHKGDVFNTFSIYSPKGKRVLEYHKIHLFRLMNEHQWMKPGEGMVTGEISGNNVGLAICYDLRFPELFRHYALEQVNLILLPAEWPITRIEHWRTLLKARAIENQCFVAAANTVGNSGDTNFGGFSAIIDPWGNTLVEGNQKDESLLTSEIDINEIIKARNTIPVFEDRRPEIYKG